MASSVKNRNSWIPKALQLGKMVAIGVAVFIAYINCEPYLKLVLYLAPTPESGTAAFMLSLPIIGGLLQSFGNLIGLIIALCLWLIASVLEALPLLLKYDQENLKYAIGQTRANQQLIEPNENDSEDVQRLITLHNALNTRWIKDLFSLGQWAMIFDGAVSAFGYPPITIAPGEFIGNAMNGAVLPSDFHLWHCICLGICIFSTNALIYIFKVFFDGIKNYATTTTTKV